MKMMFVLTTIKHEPNKILADPLRRWLSCLNMSAVLHTPLPDTCSCPPPSLAIHVCISCLIQFRLTSPSPAWLGSHNTPLAGDSWLRWHYAGALLGSTQHCTVLCRGTCWAAHRCQTREQNIFQSSAERCRGRVYSHWFSTRVDAVVMDRWYNGPLMVLAAGTFASYLPVTPALPVTSSSGPLPLDYSTIHFIWFADC